MVGSACSLSMRSCMTPSSSVMLEWATVVALGSVSIFTPCSGLNSGTLTAAAALPTCKRPHHEPELLEGHA